MLLNPLFKKLGVGGHTRNPSSGESETGKSQGLNNSSNLLGKSLANERLCLKEKEKVFEAQQPCCLWSTHTYKHASTPGLLSFRHGQVRRPIERSNSAYSCGDHGVAGGCAPQTDRVGRGLETGGLRT